MNQKFVLLFFVVQVLYVNFASSRQLFFHNLQAASGRLSPFDFTRNRNGLTRSRRCLGTALSLLWPQVVGPVEDGAITEKDYNEVPKTLLEYRLDMIRKKAEEEEENRLLIRDYMKKLTEAQDEFYGYPAIENSLVDYT